MAKTVIGYLLLCISVIVGFSSLIYLVNERHLDKVEIYPKTQNHIYPKAYYSCIEGVLYSNGKSKTKMVDINDKPIGCTNVRMTKREFKNL